MNKKIGVLVILSILLISLSSLSLAQLDPDGLEENLEGIEENLEELEEKKDILTNKETRAEYLRQEWTKILEKHQIGRAILSVSNLFQALSPIFKIFIGVEYSLSWLFFLSLGIWLAIVYIVYKPTKQLFQAKWWVALPISIIIPTLAAQTGVISSFLVFLPIYFNFWTILLSILFAIVLLFLYNLFMKTIGDYLKNQIKKEIQTRREQKAKTAEKLHDITIKTSK